MFVSEGFMMTELYEKITGYLKGKGIKYRLTEHNPVFTSSTASRISSHDETEGTKSLALDTERGIAVVTVSGDERVDFKALRKLLGVKKIKMCGAEEMINKLHTEAGGLAPFGYEEDVALVVSGRMLEQNNVYFNPGRNDATICVEGRTFKNIMMEQGAQVI